MDVSRTDVLQTDVLVIGGGGAGFCAALAAVEAGASVLQVWKAGGNSTAIAAGGFAVVFEGQGEDSVDTFVSDILRSGAGLADPALLTRLARGAPQAIEKVASWGVEFYRREDGGYRRFRSGGHTYPRSLRVYGGRGGSAYRVMLQRARNKGVRIIKDALITELLTHHGRVVGAAGMDGQGRPLAVSAKAVVLATGGMAALYEHTTNTPGMTGEGYMLAREAGCHLRDMEFVQYMPTTFAWPAHMKGRLVNDTLRGEGATLLNSGGERFMSRYDPQFMEVAGRDILSAAIAAELAAGRGSEHGGVYLDARHIPEKAVLESFSDARQLMAAGIHPSRDLIEVVPAAHFSCGGVVIDPECRTGVEGLYAVGEITGGIHGANRLGATALTENVVFGQVAGENAAREAALREQPALPEDCALRAALASAGEAPDPVEEEALAAGETRVKHILWTCGGVLRSAGGLERGRSELRALEGELSALGQGDLAQILRLRRLYQLVSLGELVMDAALRRTESRGCHRRTDCPQQDPTQAESIVI